MQVGILTLFATGYKVRCYCVFREVAGRRGASIFAIMRIIPLVFLACCLAAPTLDAQQPSANPLQLKPHHATAAVADIDRAVRWYEQMLGFKVVDRGDRPNGSRFADLALPGYGIGLVQNPGTAPAPVNARSGWMHIVFSVPDPAAAYQQLKAKGANVTVRGNPAPAQITTFLLHDSEGNEIEIVKE